MGTHLRTIHTSDLSAVVRIMNESSAGHSFAFRLDLLKYLLLSKFWNLSYDFSYLALSDSEPAGVVLNCVDPAGSEGYSFYWGVLPEFRKRRLSLALARHYLAEAKRQGIRTTYADSSADSPLDIYLKLGYRQQHPLSELRIERLPPVISDGVERMEISSLTVEFPLFPVAARSWIARPSFLQAAAPFLELLGLRRDGRLDAWIALTRWAGETTLIALDFHTHESGRQLVSHLATYPPPYSASHVVRGSRTDLLLRSCGFVPSVQWISIALDLETYSPK